MELGESLLSQRRCEVARREEVPRARRGVSNFQTRVDLAGNYRSMPEKINSYRAQFQSSQAKFRQNIVGRRSYDGSGNFMAARTGPVNATVTEKTVASKKSFADLFATKPKDDCTPRLADREVQMRDGEPAIYFTSEEIVNLALPLKNALIGKFTHGRPGLEELRIEEGPNEMNHQIWWWSSASSPSPSQRQD